MLVSGVRSSCETVEMNAVFIRSTPRISVMSLKIATIPAGQPSSSRTGAHCT